VSDRRSPISSPFRAASAVWETTENTELGLGDLHDLTLPACAFANEDDDDDEYDDEYRFTEYEYDCACFGLAGAPRSHQHQRDSVVTKAARTVVKLRKPLSAPLTPARSAVAGRRTGDQATRCMSRHDGHRGTTVDPVPTEPLPLSPFLIHHSPFVLTPPRRRGRRRYNTTRASCILCVFASLREIFLAADHLLCPLCPLCPLCTLWPLRERCPQVELRLIGRAAHDSRSWGSAVPEGFAVPPAPTRQRGDKGRADEWPSYGNR